MKILNVSEALVLVDDDVFKWASQLKWSLMSGYVKSQDRKRNKLLILHRIINKTPKWLQTDHINGDKLDNRRCNLRSATSSQNQGNSGPNKKGSSKYKGVRHSVRDKILKKPWMASIHQDGSLKHLGYYKTEIEAAHSYDKAALKHFGKYAWLNFAEEVKAGDR